MNLGCGFDTLYWNLHADNELPKHGFYELDMRPVTERKAIIIKNKKGLLEKLLNPRFEGAECVSESYRLLSCDLNNISEVRRKLFDSGADSSIPTLFIAECVFVYMPHKSTEALFSFVASEFQAAMFVDYDPIR